jgi:hypothetical protein
VLPIIVLRRVEVRGSWLLTGIVFLVSEVHPFDDGNGRVARVMTNAGSASGGQARWPARAA